MQHVDFLLVSLASWYLAYVIAQLDGPFAVFTWLKAKGKLFTCIYCLAIWIAVIWYLVYLSPARALVYPFALAGGALVIHRWSGGFHV